jgi:hypothetical protein
VIASREGAGYFLASRERERPEEDELNDAPHGRRFYRPRALLWMGALIVLFILVIIFVCLPIMENLTLRHYYTQEEIKSQDLRVVSLGGGRGRNRGVVVFSNGDRKERDLVIELMGICTIAPTAVVFIWLAYFTRPAKIYDDGADSKADTP